MSALRSHRLVTALLWLALALLPLRGLAAGLMAGPVSHHATASADVDAPMPCHEAAGHDGESADGHALAAADEHEAVVGDDCPTCALCALCHGGFAHATTVALTLPALDSAPPLMAPAPRLTPHAPDGLFRPPRAHAA